MGLQTTYSLLLKSLLDHEILHNNAMKFICHLCLKPSQCFKVQALCNKDYSDYQLFVVKCLI